MFVCFRNLPALLQFTAGAEQLISLARANMAPMKPLFVAGLQLLDFSTFRPLYAIWYSEPGSNSRSQEDETVFAWDCCLQKCEGSHISYVYNSKKICTKYELL